MACNRVRVADISKYRKKYPLVRNLPKYTYVSDKSPEIENIILDVPVLSDTVTVIFDEPFSGIPSVIANFISIGPFGNVNVYITNVSTTSVTVCTSIPIVGKIAVQAIYIDGCSSSSSFPSPQTSFRILIDTTITTVLNPFPFVTSPSSSNTYRFMGVGQFDIDWGDGNIDLAVTGLPGVPTSHTYAAPGQYEIKVTNWSNAGNGITVQTYDIITPSIDGDCVKLLEIREWGPAVWTTLEGAFSSCENMIGTFSDAPVLTSCTSMQSMFRWCTLFNSNINSWNVSNVTNMSSMFSSTSAFNQPLNSWNVSSVTNTSAMFNDALVFNQPLNAWNVSNVINMSEMFSVSQLGTAFNQDISAWNVKSVTDMTFMFYFASSFDQNLGSWSLNDGVDLNGMLSNAGLSESNYSKTLIGWANDANDTPPNTAPTGRNLGSSGMTYSISTNYGGAPYSDAGTARNFLVSTNSWTITGDSSVP